MHIRILLAIALLFAAPVASAYIGPGAGISFIGALFGAIAAAFVAIFAVLFWPIKIMWRRLTGKKPPQRPGAETADEVDAEPVQANANANASDTPASSDS